MSLKPQPVYKVPEGTARVARAIYPQGNLYMNWYDAFGTLFEDQDFVDLFSHEGQPALSPVRLALVCILQFVEGLTDRQAAEAVKTRIDWKYLLCLELTDVGFDHTVLSEFRTRLVLAKGSDKGSDKGSAEQRIFDKLLLHFQQHGFLKAKGQQRTDSTHVLGNIRVINRIECVGEAIRYALNTLAVVAPNWTKEHTPSDPSDWIDRYGSRIEAYRLPQSQSQRNIYIAQVGADGLELLNAIYDAAAPSWLRELPAVETMRQIWIQNYTWAEGASEGHGRLCLCLCLRWRQSNELPPASLYISSPYDPQARYNRKRSTSWVGYKVHLTETHDEDSPHLITNVETTSATTADGAMTTPIHESLQNKELLPAIHTVDTGYVDAELLVTSQTAFGVELLGPTRHGVRWQERQGEGFTLSDFTIDWNKQQAICPAGQSSTSWTPAVDGRKNEVISIKFAHSDCGSCRFQPQCTRSNPPRRTLTIRPEARYKALQASREFQQSESFAKQYAKRAGIEGTISQGVRRCGMRRSRYIGLAKTHLQHLLTAAAINMVRVMHWLDGELPGQTRQSAFVRLHTAVA